MSVEGVEFGVWGIGVSGYGLEFREYDSECWIQLSVVGD